MMIRLPEEYLLLALDDDSGRPLLGSSELQLGLAGATIAELMLDGALEISDGLDGGKEGRFHVTGRVTPADPLRREMLDVLDGRRPKDGVARIGHGGFAKKLRDALQQGLAERGALREEQRTYLGLFPSTIWPAHDPAPEAAVRERVLAALTGAGEPDERTAVLVSLLLATGLTRKVYPDQDRRELKRRAKEISESEWAGTAVKKAIDDVNAAMIAMISASTTATSAVVTST